jgi:lipoprotein-releasing system permease protein
MNYKLLFSISKTHLLTRKKQSGIAALGVTFGIGTYIIMMGFMNGRRLCVTSRVGPP